MRLSRTLCLYILREVVGYAALGFLVFVSILIVQNLLRRLEYLLSVGVAAGDALQVVACLFPMLTAYAVPVAFLFGVLVAMGRLGADSEITAMRSCGVGLRELLVPVLAVALVVSIGSAILIVHVEPGARVRLRGILKDVASRGAIIEPGKFKRITGQRVVFVQGRDRENRLEKVFVDDRSNQERPFQIFAERGRFAFNPERVAIQLKLENGEIHLEPGGDASERFRRISFQSFDYEIDARGILDETRYLKPNQMSFSQLLEALELAEKGALPVEYRERNLNRYRVQLHRRLALPIAPLLFALVAVPVGLRRRRGARSWGTLLCVVLVFSYYALLSFGQFLGEEGAVPAGLALWLPNLAFAAAAVPLLLRARRGEL
jgi:lipopolysaccharide export system permease protein